LKILGNTFSNIPYYRDFQNTDFSNFGYADFLEIPVLTKDIIRGNRESLINDSYPNMKGVSKYTSGGSTGEPLEFFRTREQKNHGKANFYYANYLNNVDIYDAS